MFQVQVRCETERLGKLIEAITKVTSDFDIIKIEDPPMRQPRRGKPGDPLTKSEEALLSTFPETDEVLVDELTPQYVARGYNAAGVSGTLSNLLRKGRIERTSKGIYRRVP